MSRNRTSERPAFTRRSPGKDRAPERRGLRRAADLEQDWQLWELKQQGLSDSKIAEQTGLTRYQVEERLQHIFTAYRVELTGQVEAKAGQLIAQYEYIRDEALDSWRRSKQDKKRVSQTTTQRADGGGDGGIVSTTASSEDSHGDPKYLDAAMKALGELRRLLRVEDHIAVTVTHQAPDGGPVRVLHDVNYDELTGDRLTSYLAALGQAAITVSQPLIDVTPEAAESRPETPALHDTGSGAPVALEPAQRVEGYDPHATPATAGAEPDDSIPF